MEQKRRRMYETPEAEVFIVAQEAGLLIISPTEVTSSPTYGGFNTEEQW